MRDGKSRKIRERILALTLTGGEGHIASAFSIVEILAALFFADNGCTDPLADFPSFYLSKGHSAIALYATMLECGAVSETAFENFASCGSAFGGHPTKCLNPTIPASTGSLGHGLPICLGAAFARKLKNDPRPLFCLAGDGEMNEGSMWESLLLGFKFQLGNVCLIIDDNGSSTRAVDMGSLRSKISSFGWSCAEVNGHDTSALRHAIGDIIARRSPHPTCVVAKTTKGFGSRETENNFAWHHRIPTLAERDSIVRTLYV